MKAKFGLALAASAIMVVFAVVVARTGGSTDQGGNDSVDPDPVVSAGESHVAPVQRMEQATPQERQRTFLKEVAAGQDRALAVVGAALDRAKTDPGASNEYRTSLEELTARYQSERRASERDMHALKN